MNPDTWINAYAQALKSWSKVLGVTPKPPKPPKPPQVPSWANWMK